MEKIRNGDSQKSEDAGARQGRKVAKHCVFQCFVAPEGRKVDSLKRRVRSQLATGTMKNCTPLWYEAHFEVKSVKKLAVSDHFWKLRCRKNARRCGAKYISKSKQTKHHMFASLLEVPILKKCTPLWREANFQIKIYKTPHVHATFGGSDIASLRFASLNYIILDYIPLHYTTVHYTTLHNTITTTTQLHSTTLHYTPLH